MKILMVSIPSLHFFRWTAQLQDSGHEVHWFDISGMSDKVERINWVTQKTSWKLRWDYPGRTFIKSKLPIIYRWIKKINDRDTARVFEDYLNEIKPDVVHSFALYLSCAPIISVMEKYPDLKWMYSSWGSDLFYFQNIPEYLKDIKRVLPRINYLFTDCQRDYKIAQIYGFEGEFLGVFPGGGGYDLSEMEKYKTPVEQRQTILIKGFQGRSGRAIPVLKAIEQLQDLFSDFEIIVFGADSVVFDFINKSPLKLWTNFKIKGKIIHREVIKLMGESLIYVGNSNSDGIPNTLLEAICMNAFPIQSNPGGATAEIIENGVNGILIENPDDLEEIKQLFLKVIIQRNTINKICISNGQTEFIKSLDFDVIKQYILQKYNINEYNKTI
ncbi:glycosyltransferase [Flavobacterium sp. ARAG 55.4]|uniref:glycosyltransferase n=1 Tax=Flavobacterium sp. ARAG 55.4 TaxID=3451357 RepID=UPI003F45FB77